MRSGEWLVLARTKYMLNELEDTLYRKGFYYKNKFKRTKEQNLHIAATDWENARKGTMLSHDQCMKIFTYMTDNNFDRNKVKGMTKGGMFRLEDLKKDFGIKTDAVWFEAFDNAPGRDVSYLTKMRKNDEKLDEKPRIQLSTIHGAKGGESENVVLLTDLSENTMKAYERNADDENRLFYVGATRTKEHLHIISPKQEYKGYSI
jgi:DNA gyrase/topoisomerase IV subunit B